MFFLQGEDGIRDLGRARGLGDVEKRQVRAPVGVISVGADNDYGHPAPKHLDLLRRNGYAIYRTDQRGDVAIAERGDDVIVTTSR